MQIFIVLVVAVGVSLASPAGFLQNTPEVQAATLQFITEYNRLARLAAQAPDINIYHEDPRRLQRIDNVQRASAAAPVHRVAAPAPAGGFGGYSFSANLGSNQQFLPSQFQSAFVQQPAASVQPRNTFVAAPTQQKQQVYRGPFADTVPAGIHGLPAPVTHTPAVQKARNDHFRVLTQAYQAAGHLG